MGTETGTETEPAPARTASASLLHYYVINRRGTDYALYEGLLGEAHRRGLRGIRTRLLQPPTDGNGRVAVCAATVTTAAGEFAAIGEAGPPSGGPDGGPDGGPAWRTLIQVAEARAKARALRDALNLDLVPLEELDVAESGGDG